ncbi:hypothetical protein [Streptomyces palmae]|uniref:Uncharacterized protein n=1 Tax=Streptomyces palmae TaxID=1701085 RepID=A0A4Z0HDZ8_9ACTN|nr:hypothetical protein [Streptomyces palmae]TGB16475.1 hypothetical protein E4099_05380 [Streptomyces palmae]
MHGLIPCLLLALAVFHRTPPRTPAKHAARPGALPVVRRAVLSPSGPWGKPWPTPPPAHLAGRQAPITEEGAIVRAYYLRHLDEERAIARRRRELWWATRLNTDFPGVRLRRHNEVVRWNATGKVNAR